MTRYAVDWSQSSKSMVILEEVTPGVSQRVIHDGDFLGFIKTLKRGDFVLTECPFEPYHRQKHNEIVLYSEANGIDLVTINPRETGNARVNMDDTIRKSRFNTCDYLDAEILFHFMVVGKKHFSKPKIWKVVDLDWTDQINTDRRQEWVDHQKYYTVAPPADSVPEEHRAALLEPTKKNKYATGSVLPFIRAAHEIKKSGGDRTDFERACGSYSAGYPSYLRATFYRRVDCLNLRDLRLQKILKGQQSMRQAGIKIVRDYPVIHKENMKRVRRAHRWLFSQTKREFPTS